MKYSFLHAHSEYIRSTFSPMISICQNIALAHVQQLKHRWRINDYFQTIVRKCGLNTYSVVKWLDVFRTISTAIYYWQSHILFQSVPYFISLWNQLFCTLAHTITIWNGSELSPELFFNIVKYEWEPIHYRMERYIEPVQECSRMVLLQVWTRTIMEAFS